MARMQVVELDAWMQSLEEDLDALDALAEAAAGSASDDENAPLAQVGNTGAAAQAEVPAESDGEADVPPGTGCVAAIDLYETALEAIRERLESADSDESSIWALGVTDVLQTADKLRSQSRQDYLASLEIETHSLLTVWRLHGSRSLLCRLAKEFQNSIRKQRLELGMLKLPRDRYSMYTKPGGAANAAEADMAFGRCMRDIMSKLYALSRRGILHFVFAAVHIWNDNIMYTGQSPSLKGYHDLAGTKDLVRAHLTLMQHQQRRANLSLLRGVTISDLVPAEVRALGTILLTVAAPNRRNVCPFGGAPVAAQGRAPAVGGGAAVQGALAAHTVGPAQAQAQSDAVPNAATASVPAAAESEAAATELAAAAGNEAAPAATIESAAAADMTAAAAPKPAAAATIAPVAAADETVATTSASATPETAAGTPAPHAATVAPAAASHETAATSAATASNNAAAAPELVAAAHTGPGATAAHEPAAATPAATAATSGAPAVQQSSRQAKQVFSDTYFPWPEGVPYAGLAKQSQGALMQIIDAAIKATKSKWPLVMQHARKSLDMRQAHGSSDRVLTALQAAYDAAGREALAARPIDTLLHGDDDSDDDPEGVPRPPPECGMPGTSITMPMEFESSADKDLSLVYICDSPTTLRAGVHVKNV